MVVGTDLDIDVGLELGRERLHESAVGRVRCEVAGLAGVRLAVVEDDTVDAEQVLDPAWPVRVEGEKYRPNV